MNASEEEILEAQELGQAYNLLSLDSEVAGDGDKKSQTLADTVGMTDAGWNCWKIARISSGPFRC